MESGEAVSNFAGRVFKAVCEAEEETWEGAKRKEEYGEGLVDGVGAVALAGEDGGEEMEGEDCAGWEEVGKVSSAFEGLVYGFLDQCFLGFW